MKPQTRNEIIGILEEYIFQGKWKAGRTLPGYDEVCKRFRVSPNTVRKVYQELANRGIVQKIGKFYYVTIPEFNSQQYPAFVIFFSGKNTNLTSFFTHPTFGLTFQKVENHLLTKSCRMIFEKYENLESVLQNLTNSGKLIRGIILGGENDISLPYDRYITIRKRLQKSISLLKADSPQVITITKNFLEPKVPWFFLSVGHQITIIRRELAHFIREKHFERIRFFLQEDRDSANTIVDAFRLLPEIENFKTTIDCRFSIKLSSQTYEQFLLKLFRSKSIEEIESRLSKYRKMNFKEIEKLIDVVDYFPWKEKSRDTRLSWRKKEIWIFQKDEDAVEAKKTLNSWKISIPGQVSLLSFENNPEYLHHGVSACIPDWETTGYQLGRALLSEGIVSKTSKGFLATSALVLERLTTPY